MHVLLMQNELCVNDLSEGIKHRYPHSSFIETTGSQFPMNRPVLTNKWLIKVKLGKRLKKQISNAAKVKEIANFIFVGNNKKEDIMQILDENEFNYQVVNNLRPSLAKLVEYVKTALGVVDSIAEYVVEKSNYYEPAVIKNAQILSLVKQKKLCRLDVDKYLQGSAGISFNYLYRYILFREGEYKKIVQLVYRYQSAPWVLCKFLINRLKQDITLVEGVMDGDLCDENYIAYAEKHHISQYRVQQALIMCTTVTLETLYAKHLVFESLLDKDCIEFLLKGCK